MNNSWKLSHKLSFFAMLISAIVIIATSVVNLTTQNRLAYEQAMRGIQVLAEATAYNIAAPTLFEDEESADSILRALQQEQMIISARLLNASQKPIAQFSQNEDKGHSHHQQIKVPVIWREKTVGSLIIDVDMSLLKERLVNEIGISLILTVLAVISAGLLVRWMSNWLTQPLQALSDVAQQISRDGDYNLRANSRPNNDEVGSLTKNFNKMLSLIEKQDTHLRQQQEDLKSNEKRLTLATASAGLGVWDYNILEDTLFWDDRMYQLYGTIRTNENCIKIWFASLHLEDKKRVLEEHEAAMRGDSEYDTVFRIVCPDGTVKHIKANAVVLRDNKGQPERMLGINADISEQVQTVEKLQEAAELKERLAHVSKMESVGQLTAGVAHDFNNMLGAIMGFSEICRLKASKGDIDSVVHYQDKILDAGNRAKELISQMLTFSRAQTHSQDDAPIVSLNTIFDDVISLFRPIIPATIKLNCQLPTEDLRARIQPLHLQQILLNLGVNARDASGEYGTININMSKITLHEEQCDSCKNIFNGDFAVIQVIDYGTGISPSALENIFDPFFTTKDIGKGTGMGLSVVHGLVHAEGGHIQVESELGKGTRFKIYLPLVSDNIENCVSPEEQQLDDLHGIRIMLVDDEPTLTEILAELFSAIGADVVECNDPVEALELFVREKDSIDIVITDETMPGMSGVMLSEKMLLLKPALPIILCTGYSEHANAETAAEHGIAGFFYKPVNMNDLRLKVQTLVQQKVD